MDRKRRKGWFQHCPLSYDQARCIHPPFVECFAIQSFSIASDFDPKLMPKMQCDEKSLHRHTIPSFASSKSPFWLQIGSRETPCASHPETEVKHCLRSNQLRAAGAAWIQWEPSTLRRDPKTENLAGSRRRRTQPFLSNPLPQRAQSGMSAGPTLKLESRWGKASRASSQVSENSELCKKLEPGGQFQWERISYAV